MRLSVQKITKISKLIDQAPYAIAATSVIGTLVYFLCGWSTAAAIATFLLSSLTTLLIYKNSPDEKSQDDTIKLYTIFILPLVIIGSAYLFRISPTESASIWNFVSYKFLIISALIITALTIGLYTERISKITSAIAITFLLSVNALVFTTGFGFDVFIHESAIKLLLETGRIEPFSILYNGFYALIGILSIIPAQIITIIQLLVPITAGLLLSRAPKLHTLAFLTLLSPLFVSATPQALGHILLFALVSKITTTELFSKKTFFLNALLSLGITLIHPISGIPAATITALHALSNTKIPRSLFYLLSGLASTVPLLALIAGTQGTFVFSNISPSIFTSFLHVNTAASFTASIFTEIAYGAKPIAIILFIALAIIGYAKNKTKTFSAIGASAIAIAFSALLTTGFTVKNIIGYEQNAFAERLLLAACITAIPLAVKGLIDLRLKTSWASYNIFIPLAISTVIISQWYTAFPAWNSMQRTKAINTTQTDFEIVKTIDSDAQKDTYLVLADQPTSAAALHEFNFNTRILPKSPEFFYPIPTGGDIYTNYFLPTMYSEIPKESLEKLANDYGAQKIYIVVKPYWNVPMMRKEHLKTITDKQIKVQTTDVFVFEAK